MVLVSFSLLEAVVKKHVSFDILKIRADVIGNIHLRCPVFEKFKKSKRKLKLLHQLLWSLIYLFHQGK